MSVIRGQASLLDILMLGFLVSLTLVLGMYVGTSFMQAQVVSKETAHIDSVLSSVMMYRGDTYGSYSNVNGLTIAEALNLYYCAGGITTEDLNTTIKGLLDRLIKPDYNYIFYTRGVRGYLKEIWVWNRQKDVCAKYIPLRTYDIKMTCAVSNYQKPMLGIWPDWKPIPPKEECMMMNETG